MENHWCADKRIKLNNILFYVCSVRNSSNEDEVMTEVQHAQYKLVEQ